MSLEDMKLASVTQAVALFLVGDKWENGSEAQLCSAMLDYMMVKWRSKNGTEANVPGVGNA